MNPTLWRAAEVEIDGEVHGTLIDGRLTEAGEPIHHVPMLSGIL